MSGRANVRPHALAALYIEQRNPLQRLDDLYPSNAAEFDLSVAEWLARQGATPAAVYSINQTFGASDL